MNESGCLRKAADKEFYDEVKTVLALQEVGHEPEYIGHVTFDAVRFSLILRDGSVFWSRPGYLESLWIECSRTSRLRGSMSK